MTQGSTTETAVSAIVPVGDRVDELDTLLSRYVAALESVARPFELIVVLDGPRPALERPLADLAAAQPAVKIVELSKPFGEAAALAAGFDVAKGEQILTLPAYYQISPEELPKLLDAADSTGADMHIAVRPRRGASFDKIRRRVFHGLFRITSGMSFEDLGCGVRLFSRQVADEIALYGDQHRFLPALARRRGFRVVETELRQSDKDMFHGRYRLREYIHRLLDILTVFFLVRFTKKPLRFFGTIGFLASAIGGLATLILVIQRLFFHVGLADRPALLLATLLFVLGVQTFAIGLIGELIIFTHASQMKEYTVRRVIHFPDANAQPAAEALGSA